MSAPRPRPRRVEIVIDELVLRGVDHPDAHLVLAALEGELGHLATQWTSPDTSVVPRAEASRRLPDVGLPSADPAALGGAVADAVWSTLSPGARP